MIDFVLNQKVDEPILKQYDALLPDKLLEFWRDFEFGSIFNGYIKVINPNEYVELLNAVYISPINEIAIPIMVTGSEILLCGKIE